MKKPCIYLANSALMDAVNQERDDPEIRDCGDQEALEALASPQCQVVFLEKPTEEDLRYLQDQLAECYKDLDTESRVGKLVWESGGWQSLKAKHSPVLGYLVLRLYEQDEQPDSPAKTRAKVIRHEELVGMVVIQKVQVGSN